MPVMAEYATKSKARTGKDNLLSPKDINSTNANGENMATLPIVVILPVSVLISRFSKV